MDHIRLLNAAGHIKGDGEDFHKLVRSAVSEVNFGSTTVMYRPGSTGTNYLVLEDGTSANFVELKNEGIDGYRPILDNLVAATHKENKLFRLSVAPLCFEDIALLVQFAQDHNVDVLELNLGCPNIRRHSERSPMFSYSIRLTEVATYAARQMWKKKLAVKLSPYSTELCATDMAWLMKKLLLPGDAVVLGNTKPGFRPTDENDEPLLRAISADGKEVNIGGMGGTRLKELSLKNVKVFNPILSYGIDIEAAGGIRSGKDVVEYEKAGATRFHVGTAYFEEGPRIFSDILQECTQIPITA